MNYLKELKRKDIKEFIQKNKRCPSLEEIKSLQQDSLEKYKSLERIGFSHYDLEIFEFLEESSAKIENNNRESIERDYRTLVAQAKEVNINVEEAFSYVQKNVHRANLFLDKLESRLKKLILLNTKSDLFLHGVEETFETFEKIDKDRSDCSMYPGYLTLAKSYAEEVPVSSYFLRTSVTSPDTILSSSSIGDLMSLKETEGTYYKQIVNTRAFDQDVSFSVYIDLKESTYIGEIKIVGDSIETNSKCRYSTYYTKDDSEYFPIEPISKRFSTGENFTSLGEEVKGLKIIFTKSKADFVDERSNLNQYIFALDQIQLTTNTYKKLSSSEFYSGPYEILDENGEPYNYSMATIANNTCCITPGETSVSFFISNDNVNWKEAEYRKDENSNLVQFNTLVDDSIKILISNTEEINSIIYNDLFCEKGMEEGIFNFYLDQKDYLKLNTKTVKIERNLKQSQKVYDDIEGGWSFQKDKDRYKCHFYIDSIEGRNFDFGKNFCYIDGRKVNGKVFVNQGYHSFETDSSNWSKIPDGFTKSIEIEEQDRLYPYNHRYIIEGYNYSNRFSGIKVYNGVSKVFGHLLEYVPPEVFSFDSNRNNFDIFTIVEIDGKFYFKIKILDSDSSWKKEKNNVILYTQSKSTNLLYVKGVLKSNNENKTPHINSFSVRVI